MNAVDIDLRIAGHPIDTAADFYAFRSSARTTSLPACPAERAIAHGILLFGFAAVEQRRVRDQEAQFAVLDKEMTAGLVGQGSRHVPAARFLSGGHNEPLFSKSFSLNPSRIPKRATPTLPYETPA